MPAYVGRWHNLGLMVERWGQAHATCGRDLTDLLVVL